MRFILSAAPLRGDIFVRPSLVGHAITGHQQPVTTTLFQRVEVVAGGGLLDLIEQRVGIAKHERQKRTRYVIPPVLNLARKQVSCDLAANHVGCCAQRRVGEVSVA